MRIELIPRFSVYGHSALDQAMKLINQASPTDNILNNTQDYHKYLFNKFAHCLTRTKKVFLSIENVGLGRANIINE